MDPWPYHNLTAGVEECLNRSLKLSRDGVVWLFKEVYCGADCCFDVMAACLGSMLLVRVLLQTRYGSCNLVTVPQPDLVPSAVGGCGNADSEVLA